MQGFKLTLAATMALLSGGLSITSAMADDDVKRPRTPPDPTYVQECGACHAPFPAKGLSTASWQAVLAGLDQHFGTDASVEPKPLEQIRAYLAANARSKDTLADGKPALRITETSWFTREHSRVLAKTLALPQVKTASNCAACHTRAAEGRYSEQDIHVPKAGETP
ncbi:MAG TPA: hypothetical protein VFM46_14460 [Pseudomonadales bacterium]|nr:hypothetical protein [Pseudomonadales bacterium]